MHTEEKQKKVLLVGGGMILLCVISLFFAHYFAKKYHREIDEINTSQTKQFQPVVFESFEKWATYKNEEMGIEIKYPHELHLDETNPNKIVFDALGYDDPRQREQGSELAEFSVSLVNKPSDELIQKRKSDNLSSSQWNKIALGNVFATQISYLNSSLGLQFHETYVSRGDKTVIFQYGDGNSALTFRKMLLTVSAEIQTETISFCGREYEAEIVEINGKNIIQRIADIATRNRNLRICENISSEPNQKNLPVALVQSSPDQADYNLSVYYLDTTGPTFKIDMAQGKIYMLSGFDGEPAYIGELPK
jgi:hypothetical protein